MSDGTEESKKVSDGSIFGDKKNENTIMWNIYKNDSTMQS